MAGAVPEAPLLIRGVSCLGPWGGQVCPPYPDPPARPPVPEPVPGFVESPFNPLISCAVRGALAATGEPPAPDTGMVLVTLFGDTETADAASRRLAAGRPASPLLFYQSIPNSILGHLGREFGMTGPITCVSAGRRLLSEGLTLAESLLDDGAAASVLLVGVGLAPNERVRAVYEARRACHGGMGLHAGDIVAAVVVQHPAAGRLGLRLVSEPRPPKASRGRQQSQGLGPAGALAGFVELCQAFADLRRGRSPSPAVVHDIDAASGHHLTYRASTNNE